METNAARKPESDNPSMSDAAEHLAGAHSLLKSLREKTEHLEERHPELDEAIRKLEVALSILSLKTGALL